MQVIFSQPSLDEMHKDENMKMTNSEEKKTKNRYLTEEQPHTKDTCMGMIRIQTQYSRIERNVRKIT